jgi:hypothetical protein
MRWLPYSAGCGVWLHRKHGHEAGQKGYMLGLQGTIEKQRFPAPLGLTGSAPLRARETLQCALP